MIPACKSLSIYISKKVEVLPKDIAVSIDRGTWNELPIFGLIQKCGEIEDMEMFSTFNMGIGMMMFVDEKDADAVVSALKDAGEEASVIGRTVRFEKEKVIING